MFIRKNQLTHAGFYWYVPMGKTDTERLSMQLIGLTLKHTASGEKYFLCEMNYHGETKWSFGFGEYDDSDEVGEFDLFSEIKKPELPPNIELKKG